MNSTEHTIVIQNMIELNKCPGYFVSIKDGCLYSIKSGTVKRLTLQRLWGYYRIGSCRPRPTGEYGYYISVAGRRRSIPVSTCKEVVLEWTKRNVKKGVDIIMDTPIQKSHQIVDGALTINININGVS